jgi:hypothetical protein
MNRARPPRAATLASEFEVIARISFERVTTASEQQPAACKARASRPSKEVASQLVRTKREPRSAGQRLCPGALVRVSTPERCVLPHLRHMRMHCDRERPPQLRRDPHGLPCRSCTVHKALGRGGMSLAKTIAMSRAPSNVVLRRTAGSAPGFPSGEPRRAEIPRRKEPPVEPPGPKEPPVEPPGPKEPPVEPPGRPSPMQPPGPQRPPERPPGAPPPIWSREPSWPLARGGVDGR